MGSAPRSLANRSPAPCGRPACRGAGWPAALVGRLVAVELQQRLRQAAGGLQHLAATALTNSSTGVTKGGSGAASWPARSAVTCAGSSRTARSPARRHRLQRRIDVGLARQAADLDAGAGVEAHGGVRATSPSPACARAIACRHRSTAQEVQAVGGEGGRGGIAVRAASTSASQPGGWRPLPTATRQPMMLRTMWCRKACRRSRSASRHRGGDGRWRAASSPGDFAWHPTSGTELKSCSPIRQRRPRIASASSGRKVQPHSAGSSAGRTATPAAGSGSAGRGRCCGRGSRRAPAGTTAPRCRPADAVGAAHPAEGVTFDRRVEVHHLVEGMHAGVGAAGAHRLHRLVGEGGQRRLERVLHRAPARLALPAAVGAAAVADPEGQAPSQWRPAARSH
jgi:hypothetical protein